MTVSFRPYTPADAKAVADLANSLEVHFGGPPLFTASDVEEWVRHVGDPERDTRLAFADDGKLAAYGMVSTPTAGNSDVRMNGTVAADRRGRGIGRELLAWQSQRAADIHARVAPEAAWILRTGAMRGDDAAGRLYRRFGLAPVRYWFGMRAPLVAGGAAGEHPSGFRVGTGETVDPVALHRAHQESFAQHYGFEPRSLDEWRRFNLDADDVRPELSRIAYAGDEIAAFVLCHTGTSSDVITVDLVGTRPAWRGRGLASALLVDVLAACGAAGASSALLNVDASNPTGAVAIYERAGFSVVSEFVSYSRPLR